MLLLPTALGQLLSPGFPSFFPEGGVDKTWELS